MGDRLREALNEVLAATLEQTAPGRYECRTCDKADEPGSLPTHDDDCAAEYVRNALPDFLSMAEAYMFLGDLAEGGGE